MSKHVAVLMGGWSNERPVSLSSGRECAQALRNAGYEVTEVDVARDIAQVLTRLKPDAAFNAALRLPMASPHPEPSPEAPADTYSRPAMTFNVALFEVVLPHELVTFTLNWLL